MSTGKEICPYCNKRVYFAERQYYKGKDYHQICHGKLVEEEKKAAPKVFAIHEQIFCNPEENTKHKYPLAPSDTYIQSLNEPVSTIKKPKSCCGKEIPDNFKFCTNCGKKM